MAYPVVFPCQSVTCKEQDCVGTTRLPLPNPLDTETHRINWPTETESLIVSCRLCKRISKFQREDFEERVYTRTALSEDFPFWVVSIVCGEKNCGLQTRVYMREFPVVEQPSAISYAMKALGGLEARCPDGHLLAKPSTETTIRKVLEDREPYL